MADVVCPRCGNTVPSDTRNCAGCGQPLPSASPSSAPARDASPIPPLIQPGLSERLGIERSRSFIIQRLLLLRGHNYRVMDGQSRLLLTLEEDLRQELEWDVVSSPTFAPPLGASFTSQVSTPPALTFVWKLADSSGVPQAQITVRSIGAATEAMLRELWGAPVLSVSVSQKLLGDVRAIASTADGQPLFRTAGNLLQHDFTVEDAAGREVARMHEDWVSARDTYRLEVRNEVDPLAPLVLALVVDREKQ